jgi:uncharacterized protein YndB with AHSA1/START domain
MSRTVALVRTFAILAASLVLAMLSSAPARADVKLVNERGFIVRIVATVPADREKAWSELVNPADWWSAEHSFSGDAANFALDPKPGGCFCEAMPGGGVQHMMVVFVDKAHALRMRGALGPMQGEALDGTLTIQLKDAEGGAVQIIWEYVVGGFGRIPFDAMAPAVDKVLAEQLGHLAGKLGGGQLDAQPGSAKGDKPADEAGTKKADIIGR